MASIAEVSSLFDIDVELDGLLEEIEGQVESEGQAAEDLVARFQQFCEAHGEKVDRIGRFVRIMEAANSFAGARLHGLLTGHGPQLERWREPRTWCFTTCLAGTSRRLKATSSRCAHRKNSQDSVRITTKPRCRSHIAGLMRGLTGLSGKRFFRYSQTSSRKLWSRQFRRRDRILTRSKRQRCVMSRCLERKYVADPICGGVGAGCAKGRARFRRIIGGQHDLAHWGLPIVKIYRRLTCVRRTSLVIFLPPCGASAPCRICMMQRRFRMMTVRQK